MEINTFNYINVRLLYTIYYYKLPFDPKIIYIFNYLLIIKLGSTYGTYHVR